MRPPHFHRTHSVEALRHEHVFLGARHARNERRTWIVVWLTVAMMIGEIAAGHLFGSMALLADGWHMATHAAALAIAGFAYRYARHHVHDPRFAFGTGKVGELAAFASGLGLVLAGLFIAFESVGRLVSPMPIAIAEAIGVAVLGLLVNLVSAWLLFDQGHHRAAHAHDHGHAHQDDHGGDHGHHHGHSDTNLKAAYFHVLTDAATSILAIVALLGAWVWGWTALDPMMGLVGAAVILRWSVGFIREAAAVLLDTVPNPKVADLIRSKLETEADRITDLHLWQLGPGHWAAVVSLVSSDPQAPDVYKRRVEGIEGVSHLTVEVQPCETCSEGPNAPLQSGMLSGSR
ncbi:MAG TPA: CDF family Co(II)/Ni(II) efflux transporter DmeF [Alphaproteobacteria bacterium]|jgi:cation diffusion facilitator family transporter|nr:CDF family Co(II)/Ni(II) efflux transporter DmeF [Alphaproteobacteria bacterium]